MIRKLLAFISTDHFKETGVSMCLIMEGETERGGVGSRGEEMEGGFSDWRILEESD